MERTTDARVEQKQNDEKKKEEENNKSRNERAAWKQILNCLCYYFIRMLYTCLHRTPYGKIVNA